MFSTRQEAVADSLEELWISYNLIEKLKGIQCMKKLRVLYMSNNLVKEWGEHPARDLSLRRLQPAPLGFLSSVPQESS